ncbi:hypothetical protein MBLNU459_g6180t2 [Dothideomycetes sp. NU459]
MEKSSSAFGKPLSLQRRLKTPAVSNWSSSDWLDGFLKGWKNPVFAHQTEQQILVASHDGPGLDAGERGHQCRDREMQESFLQLGHETTKRLSKVALSHARVISQVDQKFILLKMPSASEINAKELLVDESSLVLVDQHAASERCILEKLFAELCKVASEQDISPKSNLGHLSRIRTIKLEKAIHFQIASNENAMFKLHAAHFARWGILYDLVPTISRSNSISEQDSRMTVLTLPPGIAERCRAEPKLLIELLRAEVFAVAEAPSAAARTFGEADDQTTGANDAAYQHLWTRQLTSCPKGIVQLLNSRACRSAIMFNDILSLQECEELIAWYLWSILEVNMNKLVSYRE